ncbi:MAG: molybdenum cofactor biosynthesis protein MoaE [Actinobacteria bacterium]|nr:MAG: molybdenum cofactor biosynthesis protein MoaE [Actinomycetota bacterium]
MRNELLVKLTADPLDPAEALAFVSDPGAGGTVLFSGTVRDHSAAGSVTGLEYEIWGERAREGLEAIGDELFERWPVCRVALLHRHGSLAVGEVSVLACCSAPHRAEAFEAARHGIERIKRDVAVWKKEHLATGHAEWVMGS